jgi:hypothetical protein
MKPHGQSLPWRGLEARFPCIANLGTINTVAEAVTVCIELQQMLTPQQYMLYNEQVWAFWLRCSPLFADPERAKAALWGLVAALPTAIVQHVIGIFTLLYLQSCWKFTFQAAFWCGFCMIWPEKISCDLSYFFSTRVWAWFG